uniref:histidine kinase n=1 Tax=Solibacter usitatus (strain Ellin6076) TaxID=234267 RepID=Q01U34_SOLUE
MVPEPVEQSEEKHRKQEVLSAQVHLLHANARLGVCVTIVAAAVLGRLQWGFVADSVIVRWWVYMALVSMARYAAARRFRDASPGVEEHGKWSAVFCLGAGMSGAGWGAAGVLLYPESSLTHQVFLFFVLGGMMLGAASLLAPRPEAFLAFLIPAGLIPAIRLLFQGDETHVAMGLLAGVFTVALLVTTGRIHQTIDSSLKLQFENRDLVESLRAATRQTEALNQTLELRVQERTAELSRSTEQLRREIANRELMEEELLRARKLESLGVLAGGIAHDFNNFLTIIRGNIEVAMERLQPDDPVQEIVAETATACRRAELLASQLLTFAKGGAPVRRLASVKDIVTDAVQLLRAGSSVSVDVSIAADLRFAYLDAGQIGQVIHNLLRNAREAMGEGGIIEVRAENVVCPDAIDTDPRVRIAIRDYGRGIPADIRPRIFDPYFTTKPGASGLGLATVYAIVAKHEGHILVESMPGVGSVFTVDLPASNEVPAAPIPAEAKPQRGTERLLVMDDEEALRKVLNTVLTRLGYEVRTARDGAETIVLYEEAMAAGSPFDAVLLDLTVSGGMGGVETAAKLKELNPSVRLVVSSGYSASSVMSDFRRYGFDAVLPKPWTSAAVSEVVRRVLLTAPDRKAD